MRFILVFVCLGFFSVTALAKNQWLEPVEYHPVSGAYTLRLWLGCPVKPIDAIIDTGSANLNVLGDSRLCPGCVSDVISPTVYTPSSCAISFHDYYDMRYGTGMGKLNVYEDDVRLEQNATPMRFSISVYTQGKHVNNVLGLAYNVIASPIEYPLLSFFSSLENQYKLKSLISVKFCDHRAKSVIEFGGSLVNENKSGWQYTPIVKKDLYLLLLQSIADKNKKQTIINFGSNQMNQLTALDSGTLGMIVFPAEEAITINTYLKTTYNEHAKPLPDEFWFQNMCVNTMSVDLKALPTLQFYFTKWDHPNRSIALDLPPSRYINSAGCGGGFVRVVFIGQDSFQKSVINFKDHKKFTPLSRGTKIIGTPLFENYIVTIHRGAQYNTTSHYQARVGFYPSKNLCTISSEK